MQERLQIFHTGSGKSWITLTLHRSRVMLPYPTICPRHFNCRLSMADVKDCLLQFLENFSISLRWAFRSLRKSQWRRNKWQHYSHYIIPYPYQAYTSKRYWRCLHAKRHNEEFIEPVRCDMCWFSLLLLAVVRVNIFLWVNVTKKFGISNL